LIEILLGLLLPFITILSIVMRCGTDRSGTAGGA